MSALLLYVVSVLVYVLLSRFALKLLNRRLGSHIFLIINISTFAWLSLLIRYNSPETDPILGLGEYEALRHVSLIAFYVFVVVIGYFLLKVFAERDGWVPWVAFFYPLLLLVVFKYFFDLWYPILNSIFEWDRSSITVAIIGLSYMAFRLSYLVLEVRNGVARMPGLSEYLGFAFFLPTILVGPINPFSKHQASIEAARTHTYQIRNAIIRIAVGCAKFLFLANIANQLSYAGIFLDGKPHSIIDLFVAAIFYYLFLYLNFSGICDIAIGVAGLIGIQVKENFDNPFLARNIREFWNRWHKTLSEYVREVVFAPLSKVLVRGLGIKYTNFCIAVSVLVVFLVIGIWHGVGLQFAVFGIIHAVGVIANHYYTILLKRVLGKERYNRYDRSRIVNAAARVLTFCYVAFSLAFFANTPNMMGIIYHSIRDGLPF